MQLTNAARRTLAALAALALLLGCLPALAEIKPLSLEEVAQAPAEQYYTSDTHYEDPSLTVDIGEGRIHETNYVYAVIKIADPSQIRTAMAYKYNSSRTVPGETMATANNAVLAINADYHNYYDYGYLVRQGVEYRMRPQGVGCADDRPARRPACDHRAHQEKGGGLARREPRSDGGEQL